MGDILLKEGFILRMEPHNANVRVIILHNGEEYVCHLEAPKKLKDFAEAKEAHIFKGRLQLFKEEGLINVIAKGEVAGIIEEDRFAKVLDELQW